MSGKTAIACLPGALPGGLVRTTYFNGMVLSQADLENSEQYWRIKRQLTSRAIAGEGGVVWGLRLTWNSTLHQFQLSPGYALDCCGNDLVVPCAVTLRDSDLPQDSALPASVSSGKDSVPTHANPSAAPIFDPTVRAAVVLQYVECPEDPRPVFSDPCTAASDACETARMRETSRLILAPPMPPPTSPIDVFWQGLDEFKKSLTATELGAIFPGNAAGAGGPAPAANASGATVNATGQPFPFTLHLLIGSIDKEFSVDGSSPSPGPVDSTDSPAKLRLELRPAPGWGFSKGSVRATEGAPSLAEVSPGGGTLAWSPIPPATTPTPTATTTTQSLIENLGYTPLFGTEGFLLPQIQIGVSVTSIAGAVNHTFALSIKVPKPPTPISSAKGETCFDPLRRLVFEDGPNPVSTYPKGIVLGAAYAVMAEALKQTSQATPAQRDLARMVYSLVWKTLFSADVTAAAQDGNALTRLNGLLKRLFATWCAAFYYPGPRCRPGHHGVYLGEVTLDRTGVIRSFDPLARRYVLTGPLLTHWAGLFGVAPLDVILSRLARVICCVAKIDLPAGGILTGATAGTFEGHVTSLFSAGPVRFATPGAVRSELEGRHINLEATDQVSPAAFVLRLVRALAAPSLKDGQGVRLVTLAGQGDGEQLLILEPTATAPALTPAPAGAGALTDATRKAVAEALTTSKIPALARAPLTDLAVTIASSTPIPSANHAALDAALKARAIGTVGDLLAADPEVVATLVPPVLRDDAWFAAVNDVFHVARADVEHVVASLEKVIAAASKNGHVVRRSTFADPKFVGAVVKYFPKHKALVTDASARIARAGDS